MSRRREGPDRRLGPDDLGLDDDAIGEEIDDYLDRRTRELVREGLGEAEARREAERRFGDVGDVRDHCRRIRRRRRLRTRLRGFVRLAVDLRLAARALVRRPAYAGLAVATLGLGIGANAAVFSVVHSVLLQRLPYPEPEELVQVWRSRPGEPEGLASPAEFLDWRERSSGFEHLTAYAVRARNLMGVDPAERVSVALVSGNFFATFGVEAAIGRAFGPGVVTPGAESVVLGHDLWVRRFGADPGVVGTSVRLDERNYPVVGVMPEGFDAPEGAQLWLGSAHDVPGIRNFPGDIRALRDAWYFDVIGRLGDGTDLTAADAELAAVARGLAESFPDTNEGVTTRLVPLHEQVVGNVRPALAMLFGAVGLVLLIACANVANLVLVRVSERAGELSLRRALGAPRASILSHVLAESAVLAGAGTAVGIGIAMLAVRGLSALSIGALPRSAEVALDPVVLVYAVAVAGLTCALFGGVPAWVASRSSAHAGDRSGGSDRTAGRLRSGLVAGEVAVAVVLVLGATLLLKSLREIQRVDLGFETEDLVTLWVSLPDARARSIGERTAFYEDVQSRTVAMAGVSAAGWSQTSPLSGGPGAGLRVFGSETDDPPNVRWQMVTDTYFSALGLELLAGRGFRADDDERGERVAVVNQTLASTIFAGQEAVGQRINTGLDGRDETGDWNWVRVVGVVSDTRNAGPTDAVRPTMYRPLRQGSEFFRGEAMMLAVRTDRGAAVVPDVRRIVGDLEPDAPVYDVRVGDDLGARFRARPRLLLLLLGAFAGLALSLGAIGVYGVTSFAVARRTREIGVRVALGAGRSEVVALVVRRSMLPAAVGLALGLPAAAAGARVLSGHLFNVSPLDPAAYGLVAAALLAVTVAASWWPARAAARVDPVRAIRAD